MIELPRELIAESLSDNELVLPCALALRALDILEEQGAQLLGWERFSNQFPGKARDCACDSVCGHRRTL